MYLSICDAMRDLVPFVKFEKNVKKDPWRMLLLVKFT